MAEYAMREGGEGEHSVNVSSLTAVVTEECRTLGQIDTSTT